MNKNQSSLVIASIGLSITSWPVAFNFGVSNTVLYPYLFSILAASIGILLAQGILGIREYSSATVRNIARTVLSLPSIWLLVEILAHGSNSAIVEWLRFGLAFATGFISLPFITYYIAIKVVPGIDGVRTKKEIKTLCAVFVVIVILAYTSGLFHNYIVSCEDFEMAGSMVPDNCWNGQ